MKAVIIFVLLFATVLCRPARKVSVSSSESSEEVARQPTGQAFGSQAENIVAAAAAGSDDSTESSDEDEEATEVKSDSTDTASSSDTASVDSKNSDSDDDDDDDDESEESETEEDESSDSSESGESSTPATATDTPVIVTEGPVTESTPEPIEPTIITDTDTGRGDSFGSYPGEYKSIVYAEDKSYHKVPSPYKSYEFVGTGKKMAYDMTHGNEVEKSLKVYKVQALQVHSEILEEDTSTPEVESQGLDASYDTSQDQELSARQASLPEEEQSISTTDATASDSESSSTPEEEEDESNGSESNSVSQESEDEESESSEEATAMPGAADSDSDESDSTESDSDEEGAGPDTTTDMPVVITAK